MENYIISLLSYIISIVLRIFTWTNLDDEYRIIQCHCHKIASSIPHQLVWDETRQGRERDWNFFKILLFQFTDFPSKYEIVNEQRLSSYFLQMIRLTWIRIKNLFLDEFSINFLPIRFQWLIYIGITFSSEQIDFKNEFQRAFTKISTHFIWTKDKKTIVLNRNELA